MSEVLSVSVEGRTFVPADRMPPSFWDRLSGKDAAARFCFPEEPDTDAVHVASDGSEWVWHGDEWAQVLGPVDVPVLQAELRRDRDYIKRIEAEWNEAVARSDKAERERDESLGWEPDIELCARLRTAERDAARREGLAQGWDEAYEQGIWDERTSEDNIGIAGLGGKVGPCRSNPYRTGADQ